MNFNDNNKAIYLQIADKIMEDILSGRYAEGERIPSVRETATELEVNVNTVVRSYDWLQQKELIQNRRGIGYFTAEGAVATVREIMKERLLKDARRLFERAASLGISLETLLKL